MKSVLISIQPKWCELIAQGKKTVEVRKTRPKLETPFKVYIYCTKGETIYLPRDIFRNEALNGKVIGEFVCDEIITAELGHYCNIPCKESQLDVLDLMDYADEKTVYGWHISDLVIYDKPKTLSEFKHECKNTYNFSSRCCEGCDYYYTESNESIGFYDDCACDCLPPMKRPPQSWCYVEELE
jgi:predicted transcriptional regulator